MVGKMICDARKARNMTHQELAALVGVTQGHLSQIERDRIDPSLSVLVKLSQVLEIPLSALFSETRTDDYALSKAGMRSEVFWHDGSLRYQLLTPNIRLSPIKPEIDLMLVSLSPNSRVGEGVMPENCEEFLFMVSGQIEYQNDQRCATVLENECAYAPNNTGFQIRNATGEEAVFLWATVPIKQLNGVPSKATKKRAVKAEGVDQLGGRIRALRLAQSMKTIDLANAIGVSAAHISRLEHNQINPSLAVLRRISEVLNVSLVNLFSRQVPPDETFIIGKKQSHLHINKNQYLDYSLTPSLIAPGGKTHLLTAYLTVVKSGSVPNHDFVIHSSPEITYVLKGNIQVHMHEDRIVEMGQGDCLYMDRAVPHKAYNTGDTDAEVLYIAT